MSTKHRNHGTLFCSASFYVVDWLSELFFLWRFGRRYWCLVGSGVCTCCLSKFSEDILILAWRCSSEVETCCHIKDMTLTDCDDENFSFYNTYKLFSPRTFGLNVFLRTRKKFIPWVSATAICPVFWALKHCIWCNAAVELTLELLRIRETFTSNLRLTWLRFFVASLSYSRQTPRHYLNPYPAKVENMASF